MTSDEFREFLRFALASVADRLDVKAGEYADEDDRFWNFKVAGRMRDCEPEVALWMFMTKHEVAVEDFVLGVRPVTKEALEEKIGDMIAYLFLLWGMLLEEVDKERM